MLFVSYISKYNFSYTTFKSLRSIHFYELILLIQQGCIKLFKKYIYNGTKDFLKNSSTVYSSKHPEKKNQSSHKKNIEQHNCLTLIIRNVSNHHIRMISEASCDTDDWSNNAENSALHLRNNYT